MKNNPFPVELRTMAFVPRWSIVWHTIPDYIAGHSYFVTVYAHSIAKLIGWKGPMEYLMLSALMHDVDETITGDIVGPVKSAIIDQAGMEDFIDSQIYDRLQGTIDIFEEIENSTEPQFIREARAIVLVADKLDALLWLIVNQRMGNSVVTPMIDGATKSVEGAWRALPANSDELSRLWNTVAMPAIKRHFTEGGKGV